jgi:endonuclease/exonuclease/phosphatase family metal-dependent hydrolase
MSASAEGGAPAHGPARARLRALIAALLATVAVGCLAAPAAQAFRAMTWNIGGGPSNEVAGPRFVHSMPFRISDVAAVIGRYRPDVLALQEVCSWQAQALGNVLGYSVFHTATVGGLADPRAGANGNCDFGDAVLTRRSWAAGGLYHRDLLPPAQCKDYGQQSGIAECRDQMGVLAQVAGRWVRATSAHLGSQFEPYRTPDGQGEQLRRLVDEASRAESAALMMGDYNLSPQDRRLTPRMARLGYKDAGGSTPGKRCDPRAGCGLTFPSGGAFGTPYLKGDYIYFRGFAYAPRGRRGPVSANVGTRPASDHKPLIADLVATLPVVGITAPASGLSTTARRPQITGVSSGGASPQAPVSLDVHAGASAAGPVVFSAQPVPAGDGNWSVDTPLDLADGVYTVVASWQGVRSGLSTFIVDNTPPSTSIADGPQGIAGPNPKFGFSSTEPDSAFEHAPSYECSLDGAAFAPCGPAFRFHGLNETQHTVRVRSIDAAGNVDPNGDARSFNVDATPPQTTILTPPPAVDATTAVFSFASNEAGSTFRCTLDNGPRRRCAQTQAFRALTPGRHTLKVQAADPVVNIDPVGATVSWLTAPVLTHLQVRPGRFSLPPAKAPKPATTISFQLSGKAKVRIAFEQPAAGVLVAGTCVAPEAAPPGAPAPACTRWLSSGRVLQVAGKLGLNRLTFAGRIRRRALAPGRYRLAATPSDPVAGSGLPRTVFVTVAKRR